MAVQHARGLTEAHELEAVKRELLTAEDADLTREGRLRIGMFACGLIAAWGFPDDVNRTVRARYTRRQYVCREPRRYAYTRDGYITPWQD